MATVLIIERDADLRRLYAAVVRGLGHEPAFLDGIGIPPAADVLLVEPAHPECLEVALLLREQHADLPIVCASIHGAAATSDLLEPAVHLLKPFGLVQLTGALEAALGGRDPATDG